MIEWTHTIKVINGYMTTNNNYWLVNIILYILTIIILVLLLSRFGIVDILANLQANIPYKPIGSGRFLSIYDAMSLLSLVPLLIILERKSLFREYMIFISVFTVFLLFISYKPSSYTIALRFTDHSLEELCYKYLSLAMGCSYILTIICWILVRVFCHSYSLDFIFSGKKGIVCFSIIFILDFIIPIIIRTVTP